MENTGQNTIQNILQEKLLEAQVRNPRLTKSSFAKKLSLSRAAFNEILKGQRRVSMRLALRIADNLLLNPKERSKIVTNFEIENKNKRPLTRILKFVEVETDKFQLISDWYHMAILSILETVNPPETKEEIAEKLGITLQQASDAVERLIRLNMIIVDENNRYTVTGKSYHVPSTGVANLALRKRHSQFLELANESLQNTPVSKRDMTGYTFAIDPANLDKARAIICEMGEKLDRLFMKGNKTAVYRLSTQLFPLTKESQNQENKHEKTDQTLTH